MNDRQLVLIKKDVLSIISNKRVLATMLIVPILLTIIVPSVIIIGIVMEPETVSDFQVLLDMLPDSNGYSEQELILGLLLNKLMPIFFLVIPIMASSVMAASSFVGEKEKHTLETLLYSPLSLRELFQAKIMAGFFIGMTVSCVSFVVMLLVVETEIMVLTGEIVLPNVIWLIVMFLVAPSISLAGIAITVRGSAKAQTIEEAQQQAVFLIFPLLALIVGQFGGVMLVNSWLLLGVGVVLVVFDVLLMRRVADKFTSENLLK